MSLLVHYKIIGFSDIDPDGHIQQEGNVLIEKYEIKGPDPSTLLSVIKDKAREYHLMYKNWPRESSVITDVIICNVIDWPPTE
jgi:hypothetical protein